MSMERRNRAVIHSWSRSSLLTKAVVYICPILLLALYPFISSSMIRALFKAKMSSKAPLNPRDFPRPPLCEPTPRHLQIKWDGTLIADTKEAFWVLETTHPPSMFLKAVNVFYRSSKRFLHSCKFAEEALLPRFCCQSSDPKRQAETNCDTSTVCRAELAPH